ncbi:class I SAM-dependent methyltransferase [Parapedobacter indicus]|uniref:Methyltransferase domain-containing protein n=1 Tax=Parapedobacter indicus TaxID=1477437 RepID=A0A1I3PQ81_9SPHI|nr:class I SAM-dependent methyltransferase [Parapedobacter indicus]PPL00533.1 methyltransferase family protein [Parapedobacter indicus]SFJ23643.1 Methyltransferase domain-containing protein [Parapedobacter indicus]
MNRLQLIKSLVKKRNYKHYLEIGVFNGHILFRIPSTLKIAVDPSFRFTWLRKWGKTLLKPHNLRNRYYQKTSDTFFVEDACRIFDGKKIHIALIDGMHEYAYALRDVENTLQYLDDNGVIIMHDCNPVSADAAATFDEWQTKKPGTPWNGDVWKTIMHLRCNRDDIRVFVIDCDHGLGIITKGVPDDMLSFTPEQVEELTYAHLECNRDKWLNLKSVDYARTYFGI